MTSKLKPLILFLILLLTLTSISYANDDIPAIVEFNIVYFIAEDATVDPMISPDAIQERFNTDIVHTWQEVLFYDDLLGIDGFIIHASVIDMIDSMWLTHEYNQGLVLTAFDVPAEIFADLIGREGLSDRYTLVEDDIVFITAHSFNTREVLDGTGLGSVAIENHSSSTVDVLSTEEGQFVLDLMLEDLETAYQYKRNLLDDLLD